LPTTVKYALKLQGLPAGHVRNPLAELSRQERGEVERRLKVARIINV
jgi:dihydrodipicolinate synthase/N-acetylneuraminate lyase